MLRTIGSSRIPAPSRKETPVPRSPLGARLLLGATATCTAVVTDAAPGPIVRRLDGTQVTESALTARIEELASKANVHGVAVSVFNAGEPVYSRTFGVKRTDTKEPLTK